MRTGRHRTLYPPIPHLLSPVDVLVTGATGFLGGALARRLAADGVAVTGTGRDAAAGATLERDGVRFVRLDLADVHAVRAAVAGHSHVAHSAALASPWGRLRDFWAANVVGTAHVVEACRAEGVARLVHVSTPSVYFHLDDRTDVRETDPLPAVPVNAYAATKLVADRLVLAAVADGLDVLLFRPRAVYGPGDRTVLPRLIRALATGRLPVVGDGTNVVSLTYVDHAVDGLVRGLRAPAGLAGRVYNLADAEPIPIWTFVGRLCDRLGLPRPRRHVPVGVLMAVAGAMEGVYRRLQPDTEPVLSRYGVAVVGRTQTLSIEAARRDLGYAPWVTAEDGLERFAAWWETHRAA